MAKTQITKAKKASPKRVYMGVSSSGKLEVEEEGQVVAYDGSLFAVTKHVAPSGTSRTRKLVCATPGNVDLTQPSQSFLCRDRTGTNLFRIIGTPVPAKKSEPQPSGITPPRSTRNLLTLREPVEQWTAIAQQQQAGFDPLVRMSFVTRYVGESRATLYRKMGKEFPAAIKRGRSSFWPLSVIDKYKNGTLIATVTQHAASGDASGVSNHD